MCNGAVNVIPWDVSLECSDDRQSFSLFSPHFPHEKPENINSTESFNQIRQSTYCSLQLGRPWGRACKSSAMSFCTKNDCQNRELIAKCESSATLDYTYVGYFLYRNPYCALCNWVTNAMIEDLACSPKSCFNCALPPPFFPLPNFHTFSLTVVFDFDPRRGLAIGEHAPLDCEPGEIYLPEEGVCRAITCPTGLTLEGSTCVPEVFAIVVTLIGTIKSTEINEILNLADKNKEILHDKLLLVISKTLQENLIDTNQFHISTLFNVTGMTFNTSVTLKCHCVYSNVITFSNSTRDMNINVGFSRRLVKQVTEVVLGYVSSQGIRLNEISTELSVEKQNVSFNAEKIECVWLVYQFHETKLENDAIEIKATGKIYGSESFEVLNDTVIVCETNLSDFLEQDEYTILTGRGDCSLRRNFNPLSFHTNLVTDLRCEICHETR